MLPLYKGLYAKNILKSDKINVTEMEKELKEELEALNAKIKDAEENFGENEVREALLNRCLFYKRIGEKQLAIEAYENTLKKTVALGQKIDIAFDLIRMGFAFGDLKLLKENVERAKHLVDEGGDWERRNRLKVYEGTYEMWIRNFKKSSALFLESMATFTCTELMSFNEFVFYTIIVGMYSLTRPELKSSIIDSSDVLGAIKEIPESAKKFLFSLYNCDYKQYLISLVDVVELLSKNRYFSVHANFYCREMRIAGFTQFLVSYKSIKMSHMASQFGVSVDFLDNELSNFIGAGRLYCKIDKVDGIIETTRLDQKNELYQTVIKQGDNLLNRIHKLSRVTDL